MHTDTSRRMYVHFSADRRRIYQQNKDKGIGERGSKVL